MALSKDFVDKRLYAALNEARKGKLGTVDEYKFEMRLVENMTQLREDILQRKYRPSRGTAFISYNPVQREIFAAPFRDRVVHHFVCDFIMDWWDRRLIDASYSCRKGKGTDEGVRDLYKKMRKVSKNFTEETVVIKIDLSSYFCSIPRALLFARVAEGLERQFLYPGHTQRDKDLYRTLKFLCKEIIHDNPVKGVRRKGSRWDWLHYPKYKSLFYQRPGVGLVIGNLTSQMFSNIYLDQLDRFVLHTLKIKAYGRYVDDAFFVLPKSEAEEFLHQTIPIIQGFVGGLGLKLNQKKTFCQDIRHGVPFLGAVVYPYHVTPGRRVIKNFRKTLELVQAGEKDLECLISYLGRLQHYDCEKMVRKAFRDFGLDYVHNDGEFAGSRYFTEPKGYKEWKYW